MKSSWIIYFVIHKSKEKKNPSISFVIKTELKIYQFYIYTVYNKGLIDFYLPLNLLLCPNGRQQRVLAMFVDPI